MCYVAASTLKLYVRYRIIFAVTLKLNFTDQTRYMPFIL